MIKIQTYINICVCLSCFKLLFLKSYVSTDFDVHRNWMATTFNLPMKDWYYDTTNQGTLDYPPLFAYFELLLAWLAHFSVINARDDLLSLTKETIRSERTVIFQKITVLLGDCVYYYAVHKLCKSLRPLTDSTAIKENNKNGSNKSKENKSGSNDEETTRTKNGKHAKVPELQSNKQLVRFEEQSLADGIFRPEICSCIALLLLFHPSLLLLDHIHFQYNGFLSGVLILSIACIIEGKYLWGSFWFSVLLNLKHIYLYCAPAYGMYLLSAYCLEKLERQKRSLTFLTRAGRLGSIVFFVFVITYSPFANIYMLKQILSRLFPFKRGLTHAYWAPNAWALYNLADKLLATVFKDSLVVKFDLESISRTRKVSSTSGLVEEYEHQYLPNVNPLTTFVIVGALTVPIAIKYLFGAGKIAPRLFIRGIVLTAFSSFMFGWHVHEKAIISVLLPIIPLCHLEPKLWSTFFRISLAGTYSLFPLLFKPAEYLTKLSLLIAYHWYISSINKSNNIKQKPRFYRLVDEAYQLILIINELYMTLIFGRYNYEWNPVARLNRLEFLPLMASSILSALGLAFSYFELYYDFLYAPSVN